MRRGAKMSQVMLWLKHQSPRTVLFGAGKCCALILSLGALTGAYSTAQSGPPMPRVSCRVIQTDAVGEKAPGGGVSVSNLKRIQLEVKLSGAQLPPAGLTLKTEANGGTGEPVVEIKVNMLAKEGKVPIPVDASVRGFGRSPGEQHITVVLEIPDKAQRKREIDDYLRKMEERARKEGRAAEFERLVKRNMASTVAAYERLYVSNRVGDFEFVCQYSSNSSGAWKGTVTSEPIRVRVKFDGKFFDLPNFN